MIPDWHYQPEFTFDKPSDPASWQKQSSALNVAFGTTDELYLRSEVPQLTRDFFFMGGNRMERRKTECPGARMVS